MTRILRDMIITSISINEQMRWLSSHAHELAKYIWSDRNMARQCEILEKYLLDMLEEPSLFADKDFMMNIFKGASDVIPELKDFCMCKFGENTQKVIGSSSKVARYALLVNELFDPGDETNQETNVLMEKIATRFCGTFLRNIGILRKLPFNI